MIFECWSQKRDYTTSFAQTDVNPLPVSAVSFIWSTGNGERENCPELPAPLGSRGQWNQMQFDAATGPEGRGPPCPAQPHFTPSHKAGAVSAVAACGSSLARRALVFRHIARKGLSDLPASSHAQATAVSKAKHPRLQTTLLTSLAPLNAPGVLVLASGDALSPPGDLLSLSRLESLPRVAR